MDDDTGIEVFEKDGDERVKDWTRTGEDSRQWGVTFVFKDPTWKAPSGGHSVEFGAIGVARTTEEIGKLTGRPVRGTIICGFNIPHDEFARSFEAYTQGDDARLEHIRQFVRMALLASLARVPNPVVTYT
jgi:hypothetical protein